MVKGKGHFGGSSLCAVSSTQEGTGAWDPVLQLKSSENGQQTSLNAELMHKTRPI